MKASSVALALLALPACAVALHVPSKMTVAPARSPLQQGPASTLTRPTADFVQSASALHLRGGKPAAPATSKPWYSAFWTETVELFVLFSAWYGGNIWYNLENKKALNAIGGAKGGLVWTLATAQLLVGALWIIPLWLLGIRKAPKVTMQNLKELAPVGLWSAGAHGGSVVSLGAGPVSFGQILKACEPVFSAINTLIFTGHMEDWRVYATLIPVIGGVAIASLGELQFTWLAVISAMIANESAALKAVMGKNVMKQAWVKAMGAANQYGVVNILSILFCIPIVLGFEATKWQTAWKTALSKGNTEKTIMKHTLLSGFFFYLYNEVSFIALSKVSPITHSVANTFKRIVIIATSCVFMNEKMTREKLIGSIVAILGTFLYSLAKQKYGGGGH